MKNLRKAQQIRQELGSRFKLLLSDTGLSVDGAAKLLQVSPRTIQHWTSGRYRVPYAAYKLVRVMRLFELPCAGWEGWHMHSGKLWSPEGFGFDPHDSNWWGLLVRRAAMFSHYYERDRQLDLLMQRIGTGKPPGATDGTRGALAPVARAATPEGYPTGAAGRAAKPTGPNLLLSHFMTQRSVKGKDHG